MAKVYSAPIGIEPPQIDYRGDFRDYENKCREYEERLSAEARRYRPSNPLVGKILSFPIADGSARYVVWNTKPFELVHIATFDAYEISAAEARGLRLSDVKLQLARKPFSSL